MLPSGPRRHGREYLQVQMEHAMKLLFFFLTAIGDEKKQGEAPISLRRSSSSFEDPSDGSHILGRF